MKERLVRDLYDRTEESLELEITPVLKGLYRMQGPMDDAANDLPNHQVEIQSKETSARVLLNESLHTPAISGTCNVCAAPCSSCMHHNSTASVMESSVEEGCSRGPIKKDDHSCTNEKVESDCVTRVCDDHLHEGSEGSNFFSTNSSRDSISENVESKTSVKTSDHCDTYEDVNMPPNVSSDENMVVNKMVVKPTEPHKKVSKCTATPTVTHTHDISNSLPTSVLVQDDEKQGLHNSDGNTFSLSRGKSANVVTNSHNVDSDGKGLPHGSSLTSDLAKTSKTNVQSRSTNQEKPGSGVMSRKLLDCANEFLKKYPCSNSVNSGSINKPGVLDSSMCNNSSPRMQSPRYPQAKPSCRGVDVKDKKIITTGHRQEEPQEIPLEQTESNVADLSVVPIVNGKKSIASDSVGILPDNGDAKLNKENEPSSEDIGDNQERGNGIHARDMFVKPDALKEENGASTNLEEPSTSEALMETHPKNDAESEGLEDVKVCDICGDAGREDLLAVCSRCSDGAEHTYCMLIMMDKLPEGDWLCEECKTKEEADNKKMLKPKVASGISKQLSFNKGRQDLGITLNPKESPKADNKPSGTVQAVKEIKNVPTTSKKPSDNVAAISVSNKKPPENNGPSGMASGRASPKLKTALSRESSFKVKTDESSSPSGNHSATISPNLPPAPVPTGPASSSFQARLHSPRGSYSKLSSESLKPKVKHIAATIPQKTKLINEHGRVDGKKGVVRLIGKSSSFRGNQLSRPGTNVACKTQHLNRSDDSRKHSFTTDRHNVGSSSAASSLSAKKEVKAGAHDEKHNDSSEAQIPSTSKGLEDSHGLVGLNDAKQQKLCSEKKSLPNGANPEDLKYGRKDLGMSISDKTRESVQHSQSSLLSSHDMKSRSNLLGNTRPLVSGGNKVLKCQKCNENGHSTQSCSIDKIHLTALKPSGERNSINKTSKWKDTVKAAISIAKTQNSNSSLPGQCDRLPLLSVNLKSFSNNATVFAIHGDLKQHNLPSMESACASKSDFSVNGDVLRSEVAEKASGSFLRILAIPQNDYIWKGGFEVHRSGSFGNLYNGVQAHLSTCASPRVFDVATSFPGKIQLDEMPCVNVWPSQFQRDAPTEKDIALFFFATDVESYKTNYKKLLENLMSNDLALKGTLEGVELLIFPSKKLPQRSQSWNGLFFLWGVFRAHKSNYHETAPDIQSKLREPNSVQSADSEIPSPVTDNACRQKVKYCPPMDSELPTSGGHITNNTTKSVEVSSSRPEKRTFNLNEDVPYDEDVHEVAFHTDEKKLAVLIPQSSTIGKNEQANLAGGYSNPVTIDDDIELDSNTEEGPRDCNKKDNTHIMDYIDVEKDISLDRKPNVKRARPYSPESLPESTAKRLREAIPDQESKKAKHCHGGHACDDEMTLPGTSQVPERVFFPVTSSSLSEQEPGVFVPLPKQFLESVGPPKVDAPDLELALGADKQAERKKNMPLFFDLNSDGTPPGSPTTQRNDCPASLSLSLGFPSPEVEIQTSMPDQILPQRRSNSFLFGGIIDRKDN